MMKEISTSKNVLLMIKLAPNSNPNCFGVKVCCNKFGFGFCSYLLTIDRIDLITLLFAPWLFARKFRHLPVFL